MRCLHATSSSAMEICTSHSECVLSWRKHPMRARGLLSVWWALQVMFSKPLPALSCRLNAWVTMLTCQWLMGPCKVLFSYIAVHLPINGADDLLSGQSTACLTVSEQKL